MTEDMTEKFEKFSQEFDAIKNDYFSMKAQIEFMVGKYQDQVKRYDEMSIQMTDLHNENISLKNELSQHSAIFVKNGERIAQNDSKLEQIGQFTSQNSKNLDILEAKVNGYQAANQSILSSHCQIHEDLANKISTLKVEQAETKTNVKKSNDLSNAHTLELLTNKDIVKALSSDLEEYKGKFSTFIMVQNQFTAIIDEIKKGLSRVVDQQSEQYKKDLSSLNDSIVSMKATEDKILKSINERLDAIKIPSVVGLAKVDDLKEVAKDWETVRLDSRNAYLKASNNDVLCNTLSKKLESVTLQLKSYELAK